jgi:DNA invertase Pin-like site-specific DNA recombinase
MKKIAYIRVSTVEQNTARQLDGMKFDKVFTEKVSGANVKRPELDSMLDFIRDGDHVHVHSIDRLARSLVDLNVIVSKAIAKGATVHFETEQLIFDGSNDNIHQTLHFNMLGAFAQFERSLIKQRQMEGIAKAKERGAYEKVGRKSSLSDEQVADMRKLKAQGVKVKDLMVQFGISRTSVYSYL